MEAPKRQQPGIAERLAVLEPEFANIVEAIEQTPTPGTALDDLLDAAAASWTARRIAAGTALCLGQAEADETGFPMAIWA